MDTPGPTANEPARLITVIDTEEEFDWSRPFDRRETGVSHLARIGELQAVFDAQGVTPVYAVDFAVASQPAAVEALAGFAASGRAVIGAHLHPWVTPPFDEPVTARNSYPGNLPAALEREKLRVLTERIASEFGQRPSVYTAGRYGIGPNTFEILEDLGFTVDISAMPSFDYSDDGGPDFSGLDLNSVWRGRRHGVLCIPNTSALVGYLPRHNLRGLSIAMMHTRLRALHLPAVFSRLGLIERIALSPEGYTLAEMCRLTRSLHDAGQRLFVLRLHSPSVAPGHTPYVRDESDRRALLSTIGRYCDFFRRELLGCMTNPLIEARAPSRPEGRTERRPEGRTEEDTSAGTRVVTAPVETPSRAARPAFSVSPILDADLPEVAGFWNRHLNPGIPCDVWVDAFRHPWMASKPNNGFLLRADGRLVGVLGAIYSSQTVSGQSLDFCNLTSLIVEPVYRAHLMDLLSACLSQKNLCFTDFTPTPAVAKILRLLRFRELPPGEYLVPHLPVPAMASGLHAIEDSDEMSRRLTGTALRLWCDHRAMPWLNCCAVGDDEKWCVVFWKPTVVKGIPAARILGVNDTALLREWHSAIGGHLLLHHGVLASRIDAHLSAKVGWPGICRPASEPHLIRAPTELPPEQLSFLYSELAALPL